MTGGGGGIGSGVAARFAEAGAKVVVNDKNFDAAERVVKVIIAHGGTARADGADITQAAAVERMMSQTVSDWGSIDILVNNAGEVRDRRIQKMSEAEWDFVVDLILKGSFLCSRAAAPHMLTRGYGRIINISSMSYRGNIGQANYASAKAGIIGLTTALGLELAASGITVNCIAPGLIKTPKFDEFDPKIIERLISATPVGRVGQPDDIANAVMFFADEASSFVTRQVLHVSGGNEGF